MAKTFSAKFDSERLRDMVTALGVLVNEATLVFSPEGIQMRAMDPSRVAMVDFGLSKQDIPEYVCDETQKICINLGELLKLLKRAGKDKKGVTDQVQLISTDSTNLSVKLKVIITGTYSRAFTMPVLEPSQEEVPTPKITYNVKATMKTSALCLAIEDAEIVSDHLKVAAKDSENLLMDASGDISGASITIHKDDDSLLELLVNNAPQQSTYSISYLNEVSKAAQKIAEKVIVEFSSDMPIKLAFQTPKTSMLLNYYLAPRIETE
jgi:proliferating cell nuclear antigen